MTTPNLTLPYLAAAQAQKHVTVNEAFDALDGLVQLSVISGGLTAPPGSPVEGDRYIVASGATGAWAGWDSSVAQFSGGAWLRLIPQVGWLAWNAASSQLLVWTGSAWTGLDVAMGLLARAPSVRVAQAPAGAATDMVVTEELLSGLSGASVTSTIAIPNRAIVLGANTAPSPRLLAPPPMTAASRARHQSLAAALASLLAAPTSVSLAHRLSTALRQLSWPPMAGVSPTARCALPSTICCRSHRNPEPKRFQLISAQIYQNSPTLRMSSYSLLLELLAPKGTHHDPATQ